MKRFRLSPGARRDLREIRSYIAHESIDAAGRVREEIRDACPCVAERPRMGRRREDLSMRQDVLFLASVFIPDCLPSGDSATGSSSRSSRKARYKEGSGGGRVTGNGASDVSSG